VATQTVSPLETELADAREFGRRGTVALVGWSETKNLASPIWSRRRRGQPVLL